ncbi:hypothetical protein, partial [Cysteiniphilum litorale]|uniref:hypothetical protein n=1 Tax=Cysteiniphilum litorale TaxID=2056700 RepID=UPI003F88508A
ATKNKFIFALKTFVCKLFHTQRELLPFVNHFTEFLSEILMHSVVRQHLYTKRTHSSNNNG